MSSFHSLRAKGFAWTAGVALLLGSPGGALALTLSYPDFSSVAGLTLNGSAAQAGSVLRLTPETPSQAGSAFTTAAVPLAADGSFSTEFAFRFTCTGPGCGADGIVFVLQPNSNDVGDAGSGIGFQGIPNSVGVEYDTWNNGAIDGFNNNHVGIDVNGNVNSLVRADVLPGDLNSGAVWYSWIDYDGATDLLEVRLSQTPVPPVAPLLSLTRDLLLDLGTNEVFAGFTSATGGVYENHDILSWSFTTVPEPGTLLLLGSGLAGLAGFGRPRSRRRARAARRGSALLVCAALAAFAPTASAVTIDWVHVGDPGNAPDVPSTNCAAASCGSVPYEYYISKYEVTNAQYVEFLNAKAAADPFALFTANMTSSPQGGIVRSGVSGSFTYAAKPGFADKPVIHVSFPDVLRFSNWLHNGQGAGDTETGAYTMAGSLLTMARNPGAITFLPNESEWYKAAYYDGVTATYFDHPAGSNATTACAAPTAAANTANCNNAAGGLTDVGSYAGSASPYGTFDQGGNAREWNETGGGVRGVRGGSYNGAVSSLAASIRSTGPAIDIGTVDFGFRVATLVPEPATSLLLAFGFASFPLLRQRPDCGPPGRRVSR